MTFNNYIKEKRLQANLSLRKFCELAGLDPSNWSKIERGRLAPPDDREKLEEIAKVIQLKKGSKEWLELFDLAAMAKGIIPEYVYSDEEVAEVLPIFFRTAHGGKPTEEEMDKIFRLLKNR